MNLSIVIAALNEPFPLVETIASIRATAGDKVQIIVVDDGSATPLAAILPPGTRKNAAILTNPRRIGCGPSRHVGVLHAAGDWVLLCDPHMRFAPGWYEEFENAVRRNAGYDDLLFCGTCLGLDAKHLDVNAPVGIYQGGTLNILGPDRAKPSKTQVLEAIWHPPTVKDGDEIPAVLGACYFLKRDWFLRIDPLRFLRTWAEDEVFLSVKTWLMGGTVRYMGGIRIGHIFPLKGEPKKFVAPQGHVTWNKMLAINTLCPPDLVERLMDELKRDVNPIEYRHALDILHRDWHLVAAEQARNRWLFVRDLRWLAKKFGLPCP